MIIAAICLLFWNEGSAVEVYQGLQEGLANVISITPETAPSSVNGRLVHLTGQPTGQTLVDSDFGIEQENVIRLSREAKMYQWTETSRKGKEKRYNPQTGVMELVEFTDYTYSEAWSSHLHSHSSFRHPERCVPANPGSIPYGSNSQQASRVSFGGFTAGSSIISQLSGSEKLPVSRPSSQLEKAGVEQRGSDYYITGRQSTGSVRQNHNNRAGSGGPQIGDTRVSFSVTRPSLVSIVAQVINGHLETYETESGRELLFVQSGSVSAKKIFKGQIESNSFWTWIVRAMGFVLCYFGVRNVTSIIDYLIGHIPLVGYLLGGLVSFGLMVASLLLSATISLVVIAVAWLFYRPLLGMGLLAAASIPFVLSAMSSSKARAQ